MKKETETENKTEARKQYEKFLEMQALAAQYEAEAKAEAEAEEAAKAAVKPVNSLQSFKSMLSGFTSGVYNSFDRQQKESALQLLNAVASELTGVAHDIAVSVLSYNKMSEKQAYCIAKAAFESGKFEIRNGNLFLL